MAVISLVNVRNMILKDVSFEINEGEIFALVGPSGAGKTTLLQVLAGLTPYKGKIFSGDDSLDKVPPYKRHMGYLFQDLLLFPHLTVEGNLTIAMGKKIAGKRQRKERAAELLRLMGIAGLAKRFPHELSGGEQQRVALARALASSPGVLLLDEPFSSLDFRVARYLRLEFKRLQRMLGFNALFVTHNMKEAQELADRIGVLKDGKLVHIVRPDDLWLNAEPGDGAFLEKPNILNVCNQKETGNGLIEVEWAGLTFFVPDEGKHFDQVAIRPGDIFISDLEPPGPPVNRFQGRIKNITEAEGMAMIRLTVGVEEIDVEITVEYLRTLNLSIGDKVCGILKLRSLHGC
jgi:ABC-type Fe3+/spermidine/putrescine transport system ATPase subunit